ncbi:lipocalin family protein [Zunongwangia pacifica]|uniref:Lipocalin family protein n=1 Tax=Zunongwangia pacifica TaxID=2911062 RepID=A0A9X2A0C6_9FLAO|nr:lipocalin family protein [Zunongwangia pacifica]MCL6217879.1 lipocalin family protein [Zunongwangia pacifica]
MLLFCACWLLTLSGCDNEEYGMYEVDRIVGSWKLVEVYNDNNNGRGVWSPAENVYSYTFNEDGTFSSTRFPQCTGGNYSIYDDEIVLDFDCNNNRTMGISSVSSTFIEEFDYDGNNVIFIPTYPACDKGCKLKFEPTN